MRTVIFAAVLGLDQQKERDLFSVVQSLPRACQNSKGNRLVVGLSDAGTAGTM